MSKRGSGDVFVEAAAAIGNVGKRLKGRRRRREAARLAEEWRQRLPVPEITLSACGTRSTPGDVINSTCRIIDARYRVIDEEEEGD